MNRVVRGIPVHYEELGEGRPVLLLHGIPADHRHMVASFEPIFERRSGWRRIYPDLPGHGLTPRADWIRTDDDKLQIALGLLEALAPSERFVVVGASYGGYMALGALYHRAADIDGVALLVTNPLREMRSVGTHQVFFRDEAAVASLADDERGWLRMSTVQTAANLAFYRANILPALRIADHEFLDTVEPFPFDVDTLAEPFPRPALVINARQDGATGYADILSLLESFSRGTFAILDRAGHPLVGEQPVLFTALVNEWLDRMELEPGTDG